MSLINAQYHEFELKTNKLSTDNYLPTKSSQNVRTRFTTVLKVVPISILFKLRICISALFSSSLHRKLLISISGDKNFTFHLSFCE